MNTTDDCDWCEGDGYLIGQDDGMPVHLVGPCDACGGTGKCADDSEGVSNG